MKKLAWAIAGFILILLFVLIFTRSFAQALFYGVFLAPLLFRGLFKKELQIKGKSFDDKSEAQRDLQLTGILVYSALSWFSILIGIGIWSLWFIRKPGESWQVFQVIALVGLVFVVIGLLLRWRAKKISDE